MGRAAGLSGRLSARGTERSQALEDRPRPSFGESARQAIGGIGFMATGEIVTRACLGQSDPSLPCERPL
jgi:hypothetical protein